MAISEPILSFKKKISYSSQTRLLKLNLVLLEAGQGGYPKKNPLHCHPQAKRKPYAISSSFKQRIEPCTIYFCFFSWLHFFQLEIFHHSLNLPLGTFIPGSGCPYFTSFVFFTTHISKSSFSYGQSKNLDTYTLVDNLPYCNKCQEKDYVEVTGEQKLMLRQ